MPLQTDWFNSIVKVTSPTTEVSGQDLHDFIEDAMASPEGLLYADILTPEGKIEDPSNPGIYSQIIIVLSATWQIQFWQGSGYTRLYGAKLVGGVGDQPIKATGAAGDLTVLESPVDGVTVATGSSVTEQDKADIITGVWEKDAANVVDGSHGQISRREAFGGAIWVDKVKGTDGTDFPQGTYANPVKKISDATAIGLVENIRVIRVAEDINIDATDVVDGFTIEASHASKSDITVAPGASTQLTQFINCVLLGELNGWVVVRDSVIDTVTNFQGIVHQTVISPGGLVVSGVQTSYLLDCYSGTNGGEAEVGWAVGSNAPLVVAGHKGSLKFVDKSGNSEVVVGLVSGHLKLDGTVTGGTFDFDGNGILDSDDSTGTTVSNHLTNPFSTAAAVWEALVSTYATAGSFGERVGKKLLSFVNFLGNK